MRTIFKVPCPVFLWDNDNSCISNDDSKNVSAHVLTAYKFKNDEDYDEFIYDHKIYSIVIKECNNGDLIENDTVRLCLIDDKGNSVKPMYYCEA